MTALVAVYDINEINENGLLNEYVLSKRTAHTTTLTHTLPPFKHLKYQHIAVCKMQKSSTSKVRCSCCL